jgi:hypothetical protein
MDSALEGSILDDLRAAASGAESADLKRLARQPDIMRIVDLQPHDHVIKILRQMVSEEQRRADSAPRGYPVTVPATRARPTGQVLPCGMARAAGRPALSVSWLY